MRRRVMEEEVRLTDGHKSLLGKVDFADAFSTTNHVNTMEEITNLVFGTAPGWVDALFAIRNKIVRVFGLETKMPDDYNERFEVGGYVKFFKIFAVSDDEVILGADDAHLNFRALITNDRSDVFNIKVTTLVEYNNVMGRVYMGLIKPFHRLIVKRMVSSATKDDPR